LYYYDYCDDVYVTIVIRVSRDFYTPKYLLVVFFVYSFCLLTVFMSITNVLHFMTLLMMMMIIIIIL